MPTGNQGYEPMHRRDILMNSLSKSHPRQARRLTKAYTQVARQAAGFGGGLKLKNDPGLNGATHPLMTLYGLAAASREAIRLLSEHGIGSARVNAVTQIDGVLAVEIAYFKALDGLPDVESVTVPHARRDLAVRGIRVNPICLLLWECPTPEADHA